jgi:hypothetical protein
MGVALQIVFQIGVAGTGAILPLFCSGQNNPACDHRMAAGVVVGGTWEHCGRHLAYIVTPRVGSAELGAKGLTTTKCKYRPYCQIGILP